MYSTVDYEHVFFMAKAMLIALDVSIHGYLAYVIWKWWNDHNEGGGLF